MELQKLKPVDIKAGDSSLQPFVDDTNFYIQKLARNSPIDLDIESKVQSKVVLYYRKIIHPIDMGYLVKLILGNPAYVRSVKVDMKTRQLGIMMSKEKNTAIHTYDANITNMLIFYTNCVKNASDTNINNNLLLPIAETMYLLFGNTMMKNVTITPLIITNDIVSIKLEGLDHVLDVIRFANHTCSCTISIYLEEGSIVLTTIPKPLVYDPEMLKALEPVKKRKFF